MRVIRRIIDAIKRIQKRNEQIKYNFVFNLGYRYFCDCQIEDLERHYCNTTNSAKGADIPDFLNDFKKKCLAQYLTARQMKLIMDSNSLNHCYKSARKFAKLHKINP